MAENILLDFTHTYGNIKETADRGLRYVDLSDIQGTDMFCTKEAAAEIRKRLKNIGPCGIHFLDSGNYHYISLFFAEKIQEPFSMVLIDHHTDMQKPMIEDLLSCGSWAGVMILRNPYLKQLVLIGPEKTAMETIEEKLRSKLVCISMEQIERAEAEEEIKRIDLGLPVYISIDKDVLSPYYARTNWNQGDMSVDILKKLLLEMFVHQKVIGVDVCGECSTQEPFPRLTEDTRINKETNEKIYTYLRKLVRLQRGDVRKGENSYVQERTGGNRSENTCQ